MSKWDEQILVVNRKELFSNEENHFYGNPAILSADFRSFM